MEDCNDIEELKRTITELQEDNRQLENEIGDLQSDLDAYNAGEIICFDEDGAEVTIDDYEDVKAKLKKAQNHCATFHEMLRDAVDDINCVLDYVNLDPALMNSTLKEKLVKIIKNYERYKQESQEARKEPAAAPEPVPEVAAKKDESKRPSALELLAKKGSVPDVGPRLAKDKQHPITK